MTKWACNWEKNNWQKYDFRKKKNKPILNKELIEELYKLYKSHNIKFNHVKAHKLQPSNKNSIEYKHWYGNKMADKLATNASKL